MADGKEYFYSPEMGQEFEVIKYIGNKERAIVWDNEYCQYAIIDMEDMDIYCWIDQQLFMELMDLDPPLIFDSLRENTQPYPEDPHDIKE